MAPRLLPVALLLLLASCSWLAPEAELEARLPAPPAPWIRAFPDLGFELRFPDADGRWQSLAAGDPDRPVLIRCSKAANTPVLAYPVASRSAGALRPAGALYPMDLEEDPPRLSLSWQRGFLAAVLVRLSEEGLDISRVNASRLGAYVEKHPDPWALDLAKIAEELIRDDFSAYDIDLLPARDVSLRAGPGEWFLESPFSPLYAAGQGEDLVLPGLSLGMHSLFSVQGARLRVCVSPKEVVVKPVD